MRAVVRAERQELVVPFLRACTLVACLATTLLAPAARSVAADEPAPGAIVVHAASGRDVQTGLPVPLAGARVQASPDSDPGVVAGDCVTDDAGSCTIAGLAPGLYRVRPADDPPGTPFRRIETITTSFAAYEPYADLVEVGETNPESRTFAFLRTNPPFPSRCGVRVTLVFDVSGSIAADEAAAMKEGSLDFVDALAGTPSSIAIASFATSAPADGNTDLPPTRVDTPEGVATLEAAIEALVRPDGDARYTNWDAAFRSVVGESDVVVLFTDGNPTVHGVPAVFPPVQTSFDDVEAGVLSANAVKAGARVIAVGVGDVDEISADNLAAISGPTEDVDYAITSFADVGTVFRQIADALCPHGTPPTTRIPSPPDLVLRFTG